VAVTVEQPALEREAHDGNLQYEHETAAGADVIAAAGVGAAAGSGATTSGATAGNGAPQLAPVGPQGQAVNEHKDLGRNDPCWCGSGKKFKRCHGA
jgi:preprotein translocase subunit SecA